MFKHFWINTAYLILRNRVWMLLAILLITAFWSYMAATRIKLNHTFGSMLPNSDTLIKIHQDMKNRFGEDGMVMVIGIDDDKLYTVEHFNAWRELGKKIKKINGVDSVFSVAHMYVLAKDDSLKKFYLKPLINKNQLTQTEVDSIEQVIKSYPFFKGLLYNDSSHVSLMTVFINPAKFNSDKRGPVIKEITQIADSYTPLLGAMHYSGMPYIRDTFYHTLQRELKMSLLLAALVTSIIIFIFFKSMRIVLVCLTVVLIGACWSFGTMGLLGYEVSQLMALVPPLMIVIAIPNCIYIITKYHQEYTKSFNKFKSLTLVIHKIGAATFMTNATTALGFATFIITRSDKLVEFGIVASVNVMALFFLSIIILPIVFSYMKPPSVKHTKHLNKKWIEWIIEMLVLLATRKRKIVYISTTCIILLSLWGISKMQITGKITEDLPQHARATQDLIFIENNFGGMVPFEIIINTKKKGQALKESTLKKVNDIQQILQSDSIFSKSLSLADAVKMLNQAFYNGDPEKYQFISKRDRSFLKPYIDNLSKEKSKAGIKGFLDSTETRLRITLNIKDLGTYQLEAVEQKLIPILDSILNPERKSIDSLMLLIEKHNSTTQKDSLIHLLLDENPRVLNALVNIVAAGDSLRELELDANTDLLINNSNTQQLKQAIDETTYDFVFTGISVVYAKGTHYLVVNLLTSLFFAVICISVVMSILFRSFRMVIISLLPNIIPLIITAALMGFFNIPIKPSTILVFSIALGISVDDAIHYLAKYRQELKTGISIRQAAELSIRETGVSMIYTSIVLFFGFSMFTLSEFGGTKALGLLVSITLAVAMLCNLVILPALLMSLDKWVTTKAFQEPYIEIFDEEIDEELSEIIVRKNNEYPNE
jgi:predicted RND superfamily exporter protein